MSFKRARTDQQRQKRIDEIIVAASELYDKSGFEGITFTAISDLTKFTRPTIYKYFSNKEEILLMMLNDDIKIWVNHLVSEFKVNIIYDAREISEIWARVLSEQKRMNELYSILFTILEKNVSLESVIAFKQNMFSDVRPLINLLQQLFPKATIVQLQEFMMFQFSLAIGYYPMCHLNQIQIEATKAINPEYTAPNFKTEYQKAIYPYMKTME